MKRTLTALAAAAAVATLTACGVSVSRPDVSGTVVSSRTWTDTSQSKPARHYELTITDRSSKRTAVLVSEDIFDACEKDDRFPACVPADDF